MLKYLKDALGQEQEARDSWYRHWVGEGLAALEAMAAPRAGRFLFGDSPTLADLCLVPQMFNARRFEVPLDALSDAGSGGCRGEPARGLRGGASRPFRALSGAASRPRPSG